MSNNKASAWSQLAGTILSKISAIWFALMVSAVLFTVPTKAIFWVLHWFWNLF